MIERDLVRQKKREFQVMSYISNNLKNVGHSSTEIQRTPLGDKVIIRTSRPGLIVGRKGQNISKLTENLKKRFKLENPQVEISEVENPDLDANIVAERISSTLERFGSNRFKGVMHKTMSSVLEAGAVGIEIRMSGKLPSSRAKSWRVYGGNLKKCGDAALTNVRKAKIHAKLKSGVVGIQVRILPPGVLMPDTLSLAKEEPEPAEEVAKKEEPAKKEESEDESKSKDAEAKPKKTPAKKTKDGPKPGKKPRKKAVKKNESS